MADWRRFRRVLLVAAVVLVLFLIGLAVRQAFGDSTDDNAGPLSPTTSAAGPPTSQAWTEPLRMKTANASLTISCEQSQSDGTYALNVGNEGPTTATFTVLNTLTSDTGKLVDVVAEVESLQADEFRRIVLVPGEPGSFRSCEVQAVEMNQQVLRRN